MGILKNIAIVVLLISIITFIALFGRLPAFRYVIHVKPFLIELSRGKKRTCRLFLSFALEYRSRISVQGG